MNTNQLVIELTPDQLETAAVLAKAASMSITQFLVSRLTDTLATVHDGWVIYNDRPHVSLDAEVSALSYWHLDDTSIANYAMSMLRHALTFSSKRSFTAYDVLKELNPVVAVSLTAKQRHQINSAFNAVVHGHRGDLDNVVNPSGSYLYDEPLYWTWHPVVTAPTIK